MTEATTLRRIEDLEAHGLVDPRRRERLEVVAARYAVALTPSVLEMIDCNNPDGPIARQFVPNVAELDAQPNERADPIGDAAHSPVAGIVHRYPDRVLLKLNAVCAVYCRFCFRRETIGPGRENALSEEKLAAALDYVRAHSAIWEVILTGGDPLMVSPRRLAGMARDLAAIGHVKVLRIHTRIPVVAPERITDALIDAIRTPAMTTYVALHANHPREFTVAARTACAKIVDAGIPMLGQTVLLRGVNDDVATLAALMRAFVEIRIKPYYLHHGDLAPGTSHFRTSVAEGRALMRALQGSVSGLCQPAYMLDIPGGHGKVPIGPAYATEAGDSLAIRDFTGAIHPYADVGAGSPAVHSRTRST